MAQTDIGSRTLEKSSAALATIARPIPNHAFNSALDQHFVKLKKEERIAFTKAYKDLTAEGLLQDVRNFDAEKHCTIRHAPTIGKVFSVVDELMRSVTIGIQSQPEVSSLVVGGARLLIDIGLKSVSFFPKLAAMISTLSQYLEILATVVHQVDRDEGSGVDHITRCTTNLYGDWLDFCSEARKVFVDSKGKPRRFTSLRVFIQAQWAPFESCFGPIRESFNQNLQMLLHSSHATLQANTLTIAQRLATLSSNLESKQKENDRSNFMLWISLSDFEEDHRRIFSKRHPGTGNWILRRPDFQVWKNGPASQLLWCYGNPGTGKSVLSSRCLEYITHSAMANEQIGLAFCYFNYKSEEPQTPGRILSAFIKQLCWGRAEIPKRVLSFYKKHNLDARSPSYESIEEALAAVADEYEKVFFVVDALDECQEEWREEVIRSLVVISENHPCVKSLITTRLEMDITRMFKRLMAPSICIEARNTAEDIRKFVNDQVVQLRTLGKLQVEQDSTAQQIIDTLVEKAEGMFLWVVLQIQSLCRQRTDFDILDELQNLPSGINDTYYRILELINSFPTKRQALAQRCLAFVFFAAKPLQMSELIDLAAVADSAGFDGMVFEDIKRYSAEHIIEACANLLVEDNGKVRPSHFTVQEYFLKTNSPNQDLSKYFFETAWAQSLIATSCLRYLSLGFLSFGCCFSTDLLRRRLSKYPGALYASRFFDHHVAAVASTDGKVHDRALTLVKQSAWVLSALFQIRYLDLVDSSYVITVTVSSPICVGLTELRKVKSLALSFPDYLNNPPPYCLHLACLEGAEDVVRELIDRGHPLSLQDQDGRTPMYYAVKSNSIESVRYLSVALSPLEKQSLNQACEEALRQRKYSLIPVLFSPDRPDLYDRFLGKALYSAIADNQETVAIALIDIAKAMGFVNNKSWFTPLIAKSVMCGRYMTAKSLCSNLIKLRGSSIELPISGSPWSNWFGNSLHFCCVRKDTETARQNDIEMARLLLDAGADPNANIDIGLIKLPEFSDIAVSNNSAYFTHSPLYVALMSQEVPMIELLLERGAHISYLHGRGGGWTFIPNTVLSKLSDNTINANWLPIIKCATLYYVVTHIGSVSATVIDMLRQYGALKGMTNILYGEIIEAGMFSQQKLNELQDQL